MKEIKKGCYVKTERISLNVFDVQNGWKLICDTSYRKPFLILEKEIGHSFTFDEDVYFIKILMDTGVVGWISYPIHLINYLEDL